MLSDQCSPAAWINGLPIVTESKTNQKRLEKYVHEENVVYGNIMERKAVISSKWGLP